MRVGRKMSTIHRLNHMTDALLLEDPLDPLDRVAFIIEEMTNAAQQVDVIGAVVTASTAAFHRLDLREARFPKSQHMLRKIEVLSNFTYRSECIWTLAQDTHLTRVNNSAAVENSNEILSPGHPLPVVNQDIVN